MLRVTPVTTNGHNINSKNIESMNSDTYQPTSTCVNRKQFVAYFRVSTQRQGHSGLGLEAQQAAVNEFLNSCHGDCLVEFVEVESGKKSNRPQLEKALAYAKRHKATLLIAKLDRLARNVHFISGLMASGVDFIACDMPSANKLTIHILAAVAEDEAERISQRTKAALAAAKARGVELGKTGKELARRNREEARERAKELIGVIERIRSSGVTAVQKIADELNRLGVPTPRGGKWHRNSVCRVLKRV